MCSRSAMSGCRALARGIAACSIFLLSNACMIVGSDSSLVAKAHMSVGKAYEKTGKLKKAEQHIREAERIFVKTCGASSPLTAHALSVLGRILLQKNDLPGGQKKLKQALYLHANEGETRLTYYASCLFCNHSR